MLDADWGRAYTLRRFFDECPDLHERVIGEDLSANAAAIEAVERSLRGEPQLSQLARDVATPVVMTIFAKKLAAGRPLRNVGMIVTPVLVAGYALGNLLLADGLR